MKRLTRWPLPDHFKWERCANCLGQKVRTPLCPDCKGKTTLPDPRGNQYARKKCRTCKGKGRVRKACYLCNGLGKTAMKKH